MHRLRVTTEHARLLRLLQELGEHSIDVEGVRVAGNALREAAEQRGVLGVVTGLGIQQVEQCATEPSECGRRQGGAVPVEADGQQEAALDQIGLQRGQPDLDGEWTAKPLPRGTTHRRCQRGGVDEAPAAQQHGSVGVGVGRSVRLRIWHRVSPPARHGRRRQGRRADALLGLVKEKEARPGAAPGTENAIGHDRQFPAPGRAPQRRAPVAGSGPPRPDPATGDLQSRTFTQIRRHRVPHVALMRREQTLEPGLWRRRETLSVTAGRCRATDCG